MKCGGWSAFNFLLIFLAALLLPRYQTKCFQLIRGTTEAYGCTDVFFSSAHVLLSVPAPVPPSLPPTFRRGSLCQAWLWEYDQKGKPNFQQTFFHYSLEVFRFYRDRRRRLLKPLGKHRLVLFSSGLFVGIAFCHGGTAWSFNWCCFKDRQTLCFCMFSCTLV